jgi:predicted DNA-binding transcriptional regulator AlpA
MDSEYLREEQERAAELREILDRMTLGQAFQFKGTLEALLDLIKMKIRNGVFLMEPRDQSDRNDELLTVKQAAELLHMSESWVYRHADRLPFTRRLSPKALRFSKKGLIKYRDSRKN